VKRAALLVVVLAAALLAGAAARADTFTVVPTPLVTSLAPDAAATQAPLPYAELLSLWQQAGTQYGVPWQVLAAINKIESNFGRNMGPSSAGAIGWMQFMPSTWMKWGVDANGDGVADPWNPTDAIFSAARYLQAAGAPADLYRAVFAYNHADWYVNEVLSLAGLYEANGATAFSLDKMQQNLDAARKAVVGAAALLHRLQARENTIALLSDRLAFEPTVAKASHALDDARAALASAQQSSAAASFAPAGRTDSGRADMVCLRLSSLRKSRTRAGLLARPGTEAPQAFQNHGERLGQRRLRETYLVRHPMYVARARYQIGRVPAVDADDAHFASFAARDRAILLALVADAAPLNALDDDAISL